MRKPEPGNLRKTEIARESRADDFFEGPTASGGPFSQTSNSFSVSSSAGFPLGHRWESL